MITIWTNEQYYKFEYYGFDPRWFAWIKVLVKETPLKFGGHEFDIVEGEEGFNYLSPSSPPTYTHTIV